MRPEGSSAARTAAGQAPGAGGRASGRLGEADALELAALVSAAIGVAEGWQRVVDALALRLRCPSVALAWVDLARGLGNAYYAVGHDAAWTERYNAHYRRLHLELMGPRATRLEIGAVVPSQELCPDRELVRSAYYREFLRPQGLFYGATCRLCHDGDHLIALNVMRARRAGPLRRDELRLLELLVPHLQIALALDGELNAARAERDASALLIDQLPVGVVLLDERGVPLRVNRAAAELVRAGRGLSLEGDGLHLASPAQTQRCRALVQAASAARDPAGPAHELVVASAPWRRPLVLRIAAAPPMPPWAARRGAAAIVVIEDPGARAVPDVAALRRLFGLTPAEARVARALVDGHSATAVSERLGIAHSTVRSHLRRVFAKLQVRRQSELVQLIGSSGLWRQQAKADETPER